MINIGLGIDEVLILLTIDNSSTDVPEEIPALKGNDGTSHVKKL